MVKNTRFTTNSQDRSQLEVLAKYWQGYASADEAETTNLRNWSPATLQRGMVERAITLCQMLTEQGGDTSPLSRQTLRQPGIIRASGQRIWNGLRVSIFGVEGSETLPTGFQEQVLQAAQDSMILCILPSTIINMWQDFAYIARRAGNFVLPVFPNDLNALATGNWSLLDMVEFKLYRIELLDKTDVETQYGKLLFEHFTASEHYKSSELSSALATALKKLDDLPTNWADHPKQNSLLSAIYSRHDCLLVGPSSSGKSTLAFMAGLVASSKGIHVEFMDVSSVPPALGARALTFLARVLSTHENVALIVDDLQSSPAVARYVLKIVQLLKKTGSTGSVTVLAITWPSYARDARKHLPNAVLIDVSPSDAQRALLTKYREGETPDDVATISKVAEDDVLLWRLILERPAAKRLTKSALAEDIWRKRIRNFRGNIDAAKRAAFVAALLGRYELEISEGFLEYQANISKTTFEAMVKARILRRVRDKVVIGHRSLAILLAEWIATDSRILQQLTEAGRPTRPLDIVLAFIRMASTSEIWALIKTLHMQVGFRGDYSTGDKAQILADAWQSIDSLVERVEQQESLDPTWGNSLASALFVIEALSAVGKREYATASIEFMRQHWSLENDEIQLSGVTSERGDFDQIQLKMAEEDRVLGLPRNRMRAEDINLDKFHAIWAAGLVLCAEAIYAEFSDLELQDLAMKVESMQATDGYFYPARVPWVTARVVMGLARCGRTYTNSQAVHRACDWLLRPSSQGGVFESGIWQSGTGTWNTPLETTSMCIIALVQAGIPPTDSRIRLAWNYIKSEKAAWVEPGQELAGTNAILAYLAVAGNWEGIVREVRHLLRWARAESFWGYATKTAKELLDQSCRVATIASYLIDAAWSNLKNDLPEFLAAFAVPPIESLEGTTNIAPSTSPTVEEMISKVHLGYQSYLERLQEELRELDDYRKRLTEGGLPLEDMQELVARRSSIAELLRTTGAKCDRTIAKLKQATSAELMQQIYTEWEADVQPQI